MKLTVIAVILLAVFFSGCGNNSNPGCAGSVPKVGQAYGYQAVYVANTGSNSISVFDNVEIPICTGPPGVSYDTLLPASGSPFSVNSAPTALAGEGLSPATSPPAIDNTLFVASASAKTIAVYDLDPKLGPLKNLVTTLSTSDTPEALIVGGDSVIYVADEEGYVSAYTYSNGALAEIPGSPFPAGTDPVAIAQGSTGDVYVANAGSNNISGYNVDATGVLTPLPGSPYPAGTSPSSIELSSAYPGTAGSDFIVVTNQGSNDVSVYSENGDGSLSQVSGSPFAAGSKPSSSTSIRLLNVAYVTNLGSNTISGYTLDPTTGILSPLPGSPFPAETGPVSITSNALGWPMLYVASQGSNNLAAYEPLGSGGALLPDHGSPFPVGTAPDQVLSLGMAPVTAQ